MLKLVNKLKTLLNTPLKATYFALLLSFLNLIFFHFPFFAFAVDNFDYKSFGGIFLFISLIVAVLVANFFVFHLLLYLTRFVGKIVLLIFFIINAVAIYFVNTYSVILDETMIGNVFNTNYSEASSFFSFSFVLYLLFLGILPAIYIIRTKIIYEKGKRFLTTSSLTLLFIVVLVFANASNWLWIDKYSKQLGGLAMPWSYVVNAIRYQTHEAKRNAKEILLPDATIQDDEKSVVVLVIGESARRQNFSLYGYEKNTNPLLSQTPNVYHFDANSCATYTTAGVKCILEHTNTNDLYEILPNYLYRNKVEVVWRTSNWGEPPVHIKHYQKRDALKPLCEGEGCDYDEVLLAGLKEQITSSDNNKVLIILHTSTSHGPSYSKKYPSRFETFTPVCNSVELGNCSRQELINAYDNTIVYTDYILHSIIETLKQLDEYKSTMLFVSDHGESLGEKNLYMHGVPFSIAPKEQYEIPFIVWVSDDSIRLKPNEMLSQNHVFHSVLNFLHVESPIYDEEMNIFE